MTLKEVADRLGLTQLTPAGDRPVTGVYISDMVSDVIAHAKAGDLLVTVQAHNNVLAAANLIDAAGIVLVRGRKPDGEMLALAGKAGVPVLATELSSWQVAGMLYEAGIR